MASDSAASSPSTPAWRRLGWVQILVIAALVLLAFLFARSRGGDAPPVFTAGRVEAPPPLVRVVAPVVSATPLRVEATGSVGVRNYVALTPQVGGRVVSLSPSLKSGGAFNAGETLLVIDRRDFELANDQAQADMATAAADLMLREAESDAAKANYALLHPQAEVPPLVAKAPQIAQARARLDAARARAGVAALELQRTAFALPFAGRVKESTAEVGQVLARGQPFGQAFALDALEVAAAVSAEDLARLDGAAGRSAVVRSGEGKFAAQVDRVSAELDSRSRFATLYLTFAENEALPAPGTFVDVVIDGPRLADTFVLPEAAEQIGGAIWLVADGALRSFTPRTIGRTEAGWVVAAFDAAEGVVLGAVPAARAGLPVTVGVDAGDPRQLEG